MPLPPLPMLLRRLALLAALIAATATAAAAQPDLSIVPEAPPADVESVDAIIAALYDVISGPADTERDWDRLRSLFYPGARLIPTGQRPESGNVAHVWTVDEYVERAGPQLLQDGFWEREIGRTTERFGSIAHVFSTYESRTHTPDSAPVMRGLNSIQLFDDGVRWWIVSVLWDSERPDQPIPEGYLSNDN